MALNIFIILWVCRTFHPTIWYYGILPENSLMVKKNHNFLYFAWGAILTTEVIFCSLKSNLNDKLLIMEVKSKLIERLSSYNQRNKLTNWVTIFWNFTTIPIVSVAMLLNQQIDSQKCIVTSHRKSTAYKNKSLSNYDIEH